MNNLKHLFICITPLQMLIAEKIILQKKLDNCAIFLLYYHFNKKYEYYFNRLQLLCATSLKLSIKSSSKYDSLKNHFCTKELIQNNLSSTNWSSIYLSSVDNTYVQQIVSNINFDTLITFDDGTANILPTSNYFKIQTPSTFSRLKNQIFRIKYATQSLIKCSHLHYTLYPKLNNIISQKETIQLLSNQNTNSQKKVEQVIKIFLGQPFAEININDKLIPKLMQLYNIAYYFPHPREATKYAECQYIESNLIFEDYLLQELEKQTNCAYELYSFTSTALLNICSINMHVQCYSFFTSELKSLHPDLFTIFLEQNIKLLETENQ